MTWHTNNLVIAARSAGRKLGLNKLIASILNEQEYEARFDKEFSTRLHPGDCIWDIGANVGYYAILFSERVGMSGSVHAFEPSPTNFSRLRVCCGAYPNIHFYQLAVGNRDGTLPFKQGTDELGATSHVAGNDAPADYVVKVRSAASMIRERIAPPPNAIKIDVEGHEHEVVQGLENILSDCSLHTIGIELHFRILSDRGLNDAPRKIEELLRQQDFEITWPDNSHVLAKRPG